MANFALTFVAFLGYSSILMALIIGWQISDQRYLVPDYGPGYWLGIIGGSLMLLLLLYPARKKHPKWSWMGSVKAWFRLHMVLGVLGPTLIVFHANYQLGSINSRVAFFSMVIVASSGLIGRYLYRSIHHGLYGQKIRAAELCPPADSESLYHQLPDKLQLEIRGIESGLLGSNAQLKGSLAHFIKTRWRLRQIRKQLSQLDLTAELKTPMTRRIWQLRSICNLAINEIIFSYWHILHLPLFVTLVLSGITHVIVVHFY